MPKPEYNKLAKPKPTTKAGPAEANQVIGLEAASGSTSRPLDAVGSAADASASYPGYGEKGLTKSPLFDKYGDERLGTPKVYESAGSAGSGFVNLSHLLGLNKGSGEQSAKSLAKKVREKGESAAKGISDAEKQFADAYDRGFSGSIDPNEWDPAATGALERATAMKGAEYKGPSDLMESSAYADLAKKVGETQGTARNVQTGTGLASEVSKETGLSPAQSAASAFYMGVNNPNLKRAGAAFTNLQAALDDANARAFSASSFAKTNIIPALRKRGELYEKEAQDYLSSDINKQELGISRPEGWNERISEAEQKYEQDKVDTDREFGRDAQTYNASEANYALMKGVPQELIWLGIYYDEWVAAGKPSWEDYKAKYPNAQEELNKATGRS